MYKRDPLRPIVVVIHLKVDNGESVTIVIVLPPRKG